MSKARLVLLRPDMAGVFGVIGNSSYIEKGEEGREKKGAIASFCVQQGQSSTAQPASARAVEGGRAGRSGVRRPREHGMATQGGLRACQSEEARVVKASAERCSHWEER